MTPSETALTFAREILGWEDASWSESIGSHFIVKATGEVVEFLEYQDLNSVMDAVRRWCDENNYLLLDICYYKESSPIPEAAQGADFTVEIFGDKMVKLGWADHNDLCQALMLACIEANRKLRGEAV